MRVLHISCFDNGGAGTATLRLHQALLDLRVDSKMLVLERRTNFPEIYVYKKKNKYYILFLRLLKKIGFPQTLAHYNDNLYRSFSGKFDFFSFAKTEYIDLVNHPLVKNCDVINLHWVANFIDYYSFFAKINKPIIWTMHDMNVFQGGFHYKEDEVRNKHLSEIDYKQYKCKLEALSKIPVESLNIISPSKWMLEAASKSEILRRFNHYLVPNGINPKIYNKKKPVLLKQEFHLDLKKLTILFVAESVSDLRKGFEYLQKIITDNDLHSKCEFVAVGKIKKGKKILGIKYLGTIKSEEEISRIFSAADIFVLPSREDNFPNVMLESLASGTPVVGFNIGGLKDLIIDKKNGYLSEDVSTLGLKKALLNCMENLKSFDRELISLDLIKNFSAQIQAKSYIEIYKQSIKKFPKTSC